MSIAIWRHGRLPDRAAATVPLLGKVARNLHQDREVILSISIAIPIYR